MLRTRIITLGLAAAALLAAPALAQGHDHGASDSHHGGAMAGVSTTMPANGEIVEGKVEKLVIEFEHPMVPKSVQLMTAAMERIDIGATLPAGAVERVEIPLGETLEPGGYEVTWRAGAHDHEMSGAYAFTVR